jgi:major membrane immunogen (membrane-anchored lipoprotein)
MRTLVARRIVALIVPVSLLTACGSEDAAPSDRGGSQSSTKSGSGSGSDSKAGSDSSRSDYDY